MDQPIAPQNDPNVIVVPEESALILIEPASRNGARRLANHLEASDDQYRFERGCKSSRSS